MAAITLPAVPAYYTTPRVDYAVIQRVQLAIDTKLGWVDRAYHIARVGIYSEDRLAYPQIYLNNGTDEHADIRPDNAIGSYCFFEVDRAFETNTYENTIKCFFSVVFWNNLAIIDPAKQYDYTSELIKEVLEVLAGEGAIVAETETRPEKIFDKYSGLKQELKQHLMRRFSGFKITFEIETTYSDDCGAVVIDSCAQNVARINALPPDVKACVVAAISDCPECEDVTIYESDGVTVAELIPAGGSYTKEDCPPVPTCFVAYQNPFLTFIPLDGGALEVDMFFSTETLVCGHVLMRRGENENVFSQVGCPVLYSQAASGFYQMVDPSPLPGFTLYQVITYFINCSPATSDGVSYPNT